MADVELNEDGDTSLGWRRGRVLGLANRGCHLAIDGQPCSVGDRLLLRLPPDPHPLSEEVGGVSVEIVADISGLVEDPAVERSVLSLLLEAHASDNARHWVSSHLNTSSTGTAGSSAGLRARPLPPCPAPGDPLFSLDHETDPLVDVDIEVFWRTQAEPQTLRGRAAAGNENRRRA